MYTLNVVLRATMRIFEIACELSLRMHLENVVPAIAVMIVWRAQQPIGAEMRIKTIIKLAKKENI